MGAESAILASLVTAGSGLLGVVLAKCKMMYKRDAGGNCSPICAFSDKALTPDEYEIVFFFTNALAMTSRCLSSPRKLVKDKIMCEATFARKVYICSRQATTTSRSTSDFDITLRRNLVLPQNARVL